MDDDDDKTRQHGIWFQKWKKNWYIAFLIFLLSGSGSGSSSNSNFCIWFHFIVPFECLIS